MEHCTLKHDGDWLKCASDYVQLHEYSMYFSEKEQVQYKICENSQNNHNFNQTIAINIRHVCFWNYTCWKYIERAVQGKAIDAVLCCMLVIRI